MGRNSWVEIATTIRQHYHEYVGFVVLMGTDTMPYLASALSFMLENLDAPVICTGSQIPLFRQHTDAVKNVSSAI